MDNSKLEELISKQDAEVLRVQKMQEAELAKLNMEQAKQRMDAIEKEMKDLMEDAKLNNTLPDVMDEVKDLSFKYSENQCVYQYNAEAYSAIAQDLDLTDLEKTEPATKDKISILYEEKKEFVENLGAKFKGAIENTYQKLSESFVDKRNACISSLESIKNVVKDIPNTIQKFGKEKVEEISASTRAMLESIQRAHSRSMIEHNQYIIGELQKSHEYCLQLAEAPNTAMNRLQNAGRALIGKEPIAKQEKEHAYLNKLYDQKITPLKKTINSHEAIIQKSLEKTVELYKNNPELYAKLEAAYDNKLEQTQKLDKPRSLNDIIKNAQERKADEKAINLAKEMHNHDVGLDR